MNSPNQYWSIPVWIASRSYFTGTEKARTIITNSKWWMHLVLTELSSDLWNILPQRFSLESLCQPLATLGIDLTDDEHRQEVESFLHTLCQDGVLVTDSESNPKPNQTVFDYQEEAKHISSVAAAFNDGLANEGILASVFFELTYRCNQRCVHCFNPRSTCDHSKELTTDEIIATLSELEAMGTYSITFSGGEVSLRPDYYEILREAKRRNFAISVYTNGQVSSEWIEELITLFPQTIGVSLYSANPEIHDATTRCEGSFEQSVRTIEAIVKHGIRTTIKCPLMNHTVHGYKELLNLCDRLGGIPQFDVHICPATDGDCSRAIHQILDTEILALVYREPRTSLYVDLDIPNQGRARRSMDDCLWKSTEDYHSRYGIVGKNTAFSIGVGKIYVMSPSVNKFRTEKTSIPGLRGGVLKPGPFEGFFGAFQKIPNGDHRDKKATSHKKQGENKRQDQLEKVYYLTKPKIVHSQWQPGTEHSAVTGSNAE